MTPKTKTGSDDGNFRAWSSGLIALIVATVLLASCRTEEGRQGGGGTQAMSGEETGKTRPVERVTVEELTTNPRGFYGESVTVSGEVVEAVEPGAFRIEGDGAQLLVVGIQQLSTTTEGGAKEVNEGDQIRATGELRQFKMEEIRQVSDRGIDDEYFGDFEGDPALLASSFRVIRQEDTGQ